MPAAPQYSYVDYWGTQVVAFNVDRGHEVLSITGNALVDTQHAEDPRTAAWEDVADASLTMADHLSHKLYTAPGAELAELAAGLRAARPLETARRIMERTHDSLRYVRGVTDVHTSANEAFADGAGVCQDFAHLALALAKTVGLPVPLRLGLLPPRGGRHHRRGDHRREPRLGRGVDRDVVGLRPDQRLSRWGSATSRSGAGATTPTCRRSRGSTPATPRTPCGRSCA